MDVEPLDPAVPPQRMPAVRTSRLVVPDRAALEQVLTQLRQEGWLLLGVAVVDSEDGLRWRIHAEQPVEPTGQEPPRPAGQTSSAVEPSTTSAGGTRRL